ncbi:hypothetical protein ACFLYL_02815 [Chloroflexota bacterium]
MDETIDIQVNEDDWISVNLRWDDTWGASGNDYDLVLLDQSLVVKYATSVRQNGNNYPIEGFDYQALYTGTYHIAIGKYSATQAVNFHLFSNVQSIEAA